MCCSVFFCGDDYFCVVRVVAVEDAVCCFVGDDGVDVVCFW